MLKDQDLVEDKGAGSEAAGGLDDYPSHRAYAVTLNDKGEAIALDPASPAKEAERAPAAKPEPAPEPENEPRRETLNDEQQPADRPAGLLRRHPLATAFGALLLAGALGAGYLWWDYTSHFQTTDDAFIASRPVALAPKVPGYVVQVAVTDNEHVVAGQVIARIDDRDYLVALDQARAQQAVAEANIKNVDAQLVVQQAQIAANQTQVDQAQAALNFARQQSVRYAQLARKGAGTVQDAQQYDSQQAQSQAAVKTAEAGVEVAKRQVESLQAQRQSAVANLAQAKAQVDQAKLNLGYTVVRAAKPGRVVDLTAEPGEFAAAGTNLTMFVPDDIWVTANFKENQLDDMRPGQPATLEIDAYPDHTFKGHVASIQPGSGTAFSLLPAQNATGNYVKIVQRVPVKIILDNPPQDVALGPGMSVVPSVRVDQNPSLWERLEAAYHSWRKP
jgi:membrane fusion protein (multidrug efflux system)